MPARLRPFRFLHAADLHLDSPFRGQVDVAPDLGPQLSSATFRAFERLVDLAVTEKVDFVLLAGDLYDARDRSLRAQLALRDGLAKLDDAGIRSFLVHGNHDPLSGRSAAVTLPPSVCVFDATPATIDAGGGVTVTGASYARAETVENLARAFPRPDADAFSIALLHANLGGDPAHANYAPCTLGDLAASGHRYWALGHVHTQAVHRSGGTVAAYPGNPQGRSVRETGPRGALLVDVSASGEVATRPVHVDAVRWHKLAVSIEGLATVDSLEERIAEEIRMIERQEGPSGHVLRIELVGRGPLHGQLARGGDLFDLERVVRNAWLTRSTAARFVLVERLGDSTGREIDREAVASQATILGEALRLAAEAKGSGALRDDLKAALEQLYKKSGMRDAVEAPGEGEIDRVLERALELAIDRLSEDAA